MQRGWGRKASGWDRQGVVISDEPGQVGGAASDLRLCPGRQRGCPVASGPRVEEPGINQQPPGKHDDTPSHVPHEPVTEVCDRENREMH